MTNLLDQIDRATSGLCPCGAPPAHGSAYCSDDCRPSHVGDDTDTREAGHLATPMRWRPDLVSAADDNDLVSVGCQTWYEGRYRAQILARADQPRSWHLRLDDGHRYVGCELGTVADPQDSITDDLIDRVRNTWRRLEHELTDPRRTIPYAGPWESVFPAAAPPSVREMPGFTHPQFPNVLPHPWRRRCRPCGRYGVPVDGRRVGAPCQLCEHCRRPYPGPALTPTVQLHGRHMVLKLTYLSNGEQYTRSAFVTGRDLEATEDPSVLLQISWDRLEAFLLDQIPPPQGPPPHSSAGYP